MTEIYIKYNPYKVETQINIDGESCEITQISNKRLQEWIEPNGTWRGIFSFISEKCHDEEVSIIFYGTKYDYADLQYAVAKYGKKQFDKIDITHENAATSEVVEQAEMLKKLNNLYLEVKKGPIKKLQDPSIEEAFNAAQDTEFRITVIAPMSSGKSTLLNAIIGKTLLPARNEATTAVVTKIKDNDAFDNFYITCSDKNKKAICKGEIATSELIREINDRKDESGKKAMVKEMFIEGPISCLPSNVLNTVFVDTPGGNAADFEEHGAMMEGQIKSEQKNLILYVFDGTNTGTNDEHAILTSVAEAMRVNGKQSRDRFLFVATHMDDFDTEKEPFERYLESIKKSLEEKYGIIDANIYLTSPETARLINLSNSGEHMTVKEKRDCGSFIGQLNDDAYSLTKFSALNDWQKQLFEDRLKELKELEQTEEVMMEIAMINSGIPALQMAIKEYIEKYAVAIKIKSAHHSFMHKLRDDSIVSDFKNELASSEEKFKSAKEDLEKKERQYRSSNKVEQCKKEIAALKIDKQSIIKKGSVLAKKFADLAMSGKGRVEKSEATSLLNAVKIEFEARIADAQEEIKKYFDVEIIENLNKTLREYETYIQELDNNGMFKISGIDIRKLSDFDNIDMWSVNDIYRGKNLVEKETVDEGGWVKEHGFGNGVKRFFGFICGREDWGRRWEPNLVEYEWINVTQFIQDRIGEIKVEFERALDGAIKEAEEKLLKEKKKFTDKIEEIDKKLLNILGEIKRITKDKEALEKEVKEDEKNYKWIKMIEEKAEKILEI